MRGRKRYRRTARQLREGPAARGTAKEWRAMGPWALGPFSTQHTTWRTPNGIRRSLHVLPYFPPSLLRTTRPILPLFLAPSLAAMLALPLQSSSVLASQHPFSPQSLPRLRVPRLPCRANQALGLPAAIVHHNWEGGRGFPLVNFQPSVIHSITARLKKIILHICRMQKSRSEKIPRTQIGTRDTRYLDFPLAWSSISTSSKA